jgi:hypothetical protein
MSKCTRNSVAVRSGFGIVSRYDGKSAEPAMMVSPLISNHPSCEPWALIGWQIA